MGTATALETTADAAAPTVSVTNGRRYHLPPMAIGTPIGESHHDPEQVGQPDP